MKTDFKRYRCCSQRAYTLVNKNIIRYNVSGTRQVPFERFGKVPGVVRGGAENFWLRCEEKDFPLGKQVIVGRYVKGNTWGPEDQVTSQKGTQSDHRNKIFLVPAWVNSDAAATRAASHPHASASRAGPRHG